MKTLGELFKEHGSVWLALNETPSQKNFRPLGYCENKGYLIGESFYTGAVYLSPDDWSYVLLSTEPPKPVTKKMWPAAFRGYHNWIITDHVYSSMDEAKKALNIYPKIIWPFTPGDELPVEDV